MANGESLYEYEKEGRLFAATYAYPIGTKLRVTNRKNHKSVLVVVADRGPAKRLGRLCDLSRKAFSRIADLKEGIIQVTTEEVL